MVLSENLRVNDEEFRNKVLRQWEKFQSKTTLQRSVESGPGRSSRAESIRQLSPNRFINTVNRRELFVVENFPAVDEKLKEARVASGLPEAVAKRISFSKSDLGYIRVARMQRDDSLPNKMVLPGNEIKVLF
jgi:hypothetical protein